MKKKNEPPRPKSEFRPKLQYETFEEAMLMFLARNCIPATMDWDPHELPYIPCEIRIVLTGIGSGYIHLLGQDSDTIDFKRIQKP